MAEIALCSGSITVDSAGVLICSQAWSVVEYVAPVADIDPVLFASYMGAGFCISFPLYLFAWGGRKIYKSLNVGD
jgi:hypothetical protein